jgi:hypothetical protein
MSPTHFDEAPDTLVPDPLVWREFGITSMTGWRWSNDPDLGFPPGDQDQEPVLSKQAASGMLKIRCLR